MSKLRVLLTCFLLFVVCKCEGLREHILEPGQIFLYNSAHHVGGLYKNLQIYCYKGSPKAVYYVFQTVYVNLNIDNDDYEQYIGSSVDVVVEQYKSDNSLLSINLLQNYKRKRIKLHPFKNTCIGIQAEQNYEIHLDVKQVDSYKIACVSAAIIIYFLARTLSRNELFYYSCGILVGVCASFLLLVYLISKLFPRRPVTYGILIGGWTIGIYLLQLLWENIEQFMIKYKMFVFWYIVITSFISFILCYRFGKPEDEKSRNIIKWTIQLFSLLFIIYILEHTELAIVLTVCILICPKIFPYIVFILKHIFIRRNVKRKFISFEEYEEEGIKETSRALDDLRDYCNSSNCKQWVLVTKLQDPIRFSNFVKGSSHLLDEEIIDYERSRSTMDISEDED